MKLKLFVILLMLGGLSVLSSVASADIIAEFEDASATAGVDTVPGVAGDGWRSGWDLDSTGTGSKSRSLGTADPLYVDSNNYLVYSQTDTDNNGYSVGLNRRYYLTDLNDDYYISYSIRFDDINMWTEMDYDNSGTDGDRFYMTSTIDDNYNNTSTETGCAIRVQGNFKDGSLASALQFRFLCGSTGPGSSTSEYSGFTVQEGNTYEITFAVHENLYTYEGTVTEVETGNTYTTSTLNMQSQVVANYLEFITEMRYAGGNSFGYSIDNVRIANTPPPVVPEPSTLVLLASALVGLLVWRKRK